MWVYVKECERLGESLWYQEPDSCQTLCLCSPHHVTCVPHCSESSASCFWGPDARFGVALSISAETWSGSRPSMSGCATWHVFAFFRWEEHKDLLRRIRSFLHFLSWQKDEQNISTVPKGVLPFATTFPCTIHPTNVDAFLLTQTHV